MSDQPAATSSANTFDQGERYNDMEEASRVSAEAHQSNMWTSMPALITKHNDNGTVSVQPVIKRLRQKSDGTNEWMQWPEIDDIPVQYPGAGGITMTLPYKAGDEVWLVVSSRSIDKWWSEGGVQEQSAPFRMHHPSDGFAVAGVRSKPRKLSNVSMDKAQLRTEDGSTFIEMDPATKQIRIVSPDKPVIIEAELHVTKNIKWNTATTATSAETHKHSGIQRGGAQTDQPVPGS